MNKNGFTLIEALLSLLIVAVLTMMAISGRQTASLPVFMQCLQEKVRAAQSSAYQEKEKREVSIQKTEMNSTQENWSFPGGISCQPQNFSFNARGNISQACTVHCSDGKGQMDLVFQLGSGSSRIDWSRP